MMIPLSRWSVGARLRQIRIGNTTTTALCTAGSVGFGTVPAASKRLFHHGGGVWLSLQGGAVFSRRLDGFPSTCLSVVNQTKVPVRLAHSVYGDKRVNARITGSEVLLIGEGGEQIGVVPLREALQRARKSGLDLVEVDREHTPATCRLLRFSDEQKKSLLREKAEKEHKKAAKVVEKELRVGMNIAPNDLQLKMQQASKFLKLGYRVRMTMVLKGRYTWTPELLLDVRRFLERLYQKVEDLALVDQSTFLIIRGPQVSFLLLAKPEGSKKGSPLVDQLHIPLADPKFVMDMMERLSLSGHYKYKEGENLEEEDGEQLEEEEQTRTTPLFTGVRPPLSKKEIERIKRTKLRKKLGEEATRRGRNSSAWKKDFEVVEDPDNVND